MARIIDRLIEYASPARGLRRLAARRALERAYEAVNRSRHNRDRALVGGSEDDQLFGRHGEVWQTLFELREISQDVDRNNGLGRAIVDRVTENVLGASGFQLKPNTDNEDVDKQIVEDWNEWLQVCDYRSEFSGWQLIEQMLRGQYVAGDSFVETLRDDGGKLNLFEADRVLTPNGAGTATIGGRPIVNGIARNARGRRRWYWVADKAPVYGIARADEGKAIAADRIQQLYNPRRNTQGRGLPAITPVIRDLDDLDDLFLFNKIGLKLVAASGIFIETEDGQSMAKFMGSGRTTSDNQMIEELEPMSVNYLRPGETPKVVESNRPGNNFGDFIQMLSRCVGLPLGLPYELVMFDFSQVNFASSRQLMAQAIRNFRRQQYHLAEFLSRIYRWWLSLQSYPETEYPRRHKWGVPGWPSANPLQDAQAAALSIKWGFGSRTQAAEERGNDIEQILMELATEQAIAEENVLIEPLLKNASQLTPNKEVAA